MLYTQAFTYRLPRLPIRLPVEFSSAGACISGIATDVSDTGVKARLSSPLLWGTTGRLKMSLDLCTIELEAEVVHSELLDAGLRFCFASENEAHFVRTLVRILAKTMNERKSPLDQGSRRDRLT